MQLQHLMTLGVCLGFRLYEVGICVCENGRFADCNHGIVSQKEDCPSAAALPRPAVTAVGSGHVPNGEGWLLSRD